MEVFEILVQYKIGAQKILGDYGKEMCIGEMLTILDESGSRI